MKLSHLLLSAVAATTLVACGNLSNVSKDGTSDKLVWPQIEKSKFNHDGSQFGSWPNWDSVRLIERGMNKDQIAHLIGYPHFNEGLFGVREWNYVFNYRENDTHKICQYKVLFDKDMNAQTFLWYPNGCNSDGSYNLGGDFLFDFDKYNLNEKSKEVLNNIAATLKSSGAKDIKIEGHTDPLGSEKYNLALSQHRADTVRDYLVSQGVEANFETVGVGEANQVKTCEGHGKELKDCLRPNRRVVITSGGVTQSTQSTEAGPIGPTPLYEK